MIRFACALLLTLGVLLPAPARAQDTNNAPSAEYRFADDSEHTFPSPDGTVQVEQYSKELLNSLIWQMWVFDSAHIHGSLLNTGETDAVPGQPGGLSAVAAYAYHPAEFRYTPNSQWLVRLQKLDGGDSTLFLYHRTGDKFAPATTQPLGDLAWFFYSTQPETNAVRPLTHRQAELIDGLADNYATMGEHWPDSRYLVISLSCNDTMLGWRCIYDLQTGAFSVPDNFRPSNTNALVNASANATAAAATNAASAATNAAPADTNAAPVPALSPH